MYSSDDCDEFLRRTGSSPVGEISPLAYVRPVKTDKGLAYGVYSADGTQLALFETCEAAYFAAKQHDLEPVLIH